MDSISKGDMDTSTASHQEWHSSDEKPAGQGPDSIVPIEQEALEGAQHINLSWRSWVRLFKQLP